MNNVKIVSSTESPAEFMREYEMFWKDGTENTHDLARDLETAIKSIHPNWWQAREIEKLLAKHGIYVKLTSDKIKTRADELGEME